MSSDILDLPALPPDARQAYGADPSQFGELRLPRRASDGPWPLVCIVHGGYYRARYDLSYMTHLASTLTEDGVATWTIEYRRLGEPGSGWPGTFRDVSDALDFVRTLQRVDTSRIVTLGHSAGGQLALWLANRPPELSAADPVPVTGVVALAPVADLARAWELQVSNGVIDELMGGAPHKVPDRYALASPIERVPIGVPQIVIHGTADSHVPFELSDRYVGAARAAGDPTELVTLPGIDHFAPIDPRAHAFTATREAVLRCLLERS
jgi:dipeptidyl aminopeptidase/acylaminoacyl peptidase